MMIKILKVTALYFFCLLNVVRAEDLLPDFSFADIEEQTHPISEWQGKVLVINFWATWCQPCLKEIPDFIALQSQYAKYNVQFIGIAIDDVATVRRYKSTVGINYPILIANEWEGYDLSQRLGNSANTVPYTVVVSADRKIIYRHAGAVKKTELMSIIAPK